MIDLKFPSSTKVGKPVPKNAFYRHLEVNAKMKQHFVDDVESLHWLYKLAPSTLNVADGNQVHEIVVFLAELKSKDCPEDVFVFIDQNLPRHVVFVLGYAGQYKVLLNYKEWQNQDLGTFKIVKTFVSEWMQADELRLPICGLTMDAIYEGLAGQVSGYGTTKSEDTKHIIELKSLIAQGERAVAALKKKIRNERQLNRQMELSGEARKIKGQIAQWEEEIQTIINQ